MNEYNIIIIKGIKIIVCVFILLLLNLISKLGKVAKIIVVDRKCGIIFGKLLYSQFLLGISIWLSTFSILYIVFAINSYSNLEKHSRKEAKNICKK